MVPQWAFLTILGLITFSWFLLGERKTFGEKVGTICFFLAIYLLYQALNHELAAEYMEKIKDMLGIY